MTIFWQATGDGLVSKLILWLALLGLLAFFALVGILEATVYIWQRKSFFKELQWASILFPIGILISVLAVIGKLKPSNFSPISVRFPVQQWYNTPYLTALTIFVVSCPMILVTGPLPPDTEESAFESATKLRRARAELDK